MVYIIKNTTSEMVVAKKGVLTNNKENYRLFSREEALDYYNNVCQKDRIFKNLMVIIPIK